jgi:hypothetical protein
MSKLTVINLDASKARVTSGRTTVTGALSLERYSSVICYEDGFDLEYVHHIDPTRQLRERWV